MKGMKMNGFTDYLQLPSMTMDTIEIECLIDNPQAVANVILDIRTGFDAWFRINNNDTKPTTSVYVDDVLYPLNTLLATGSKKKYKFIFPNMTDNVNIFSSYLNGAITKGTLYTVKCYLAGVLQCAYDFVNNDTAIDGSGNGRNGTLVGGTPVVRKSKQKPKKNLLPPFGEWTLSSYSTVISPYHLSHVQGVPGFQNNIYNVDVSPSTAYVISAQSSTLVCKVTDINSGHIFIEAIMTPDFAFTTLSTTTRLQVNFYNPGGGTGSFHCTNLQLELGSTTSSFEPYTLIPDVRSARTPIKPVQSVRQVILPLKPVR